RACRTEGGPSGRKTGPCGPKARGKTGAKTRSQREGGRAAERRRQGEGRLRGGGEGCQGGGSRGGAVPGRPAKGRGRLRQREASGQRQAAASHECEEFGRRARRARVGE